jgi:hypothetical protein
MNPGRSSLRTAAIVCLGVWGAIWVLFLGLRFLPFDVRTIPGAGRIALALLGTALMAPVVASLLGLAALFRGYRGVLSWFILGCALAAVLAELLVFLMTRWM